MIIDSELENRMNGMCPVARAAELGTTIRDLQAPALLWSAYSPVVIQNTTDELTQLSTSAMGSLFIPATFWQPGRMLRFRTRGKLKCGNGGFK